MPGYNGTGPSGMGPMTGRKMGRCAGNQPQGMSGAGNGRGGRGFRNRFFATGIPGWMNDSAGDSGCTTEELKASLAADIAMMKSRITHAEQKLAELNAK